jgi:predicted amidohydrolase YtcJ
VDNDNEPLGIFRENALGLIYNALPNPTVEEIKDLILKAVNDLNKCGITSVGTDDFESLPGKDYEKVIKAYKELKEENKLNMRVYEQCLLPSKNKLLEFLEKGYKTGLGDENFKIGPLKILLDGSLGARTAALNQPYSDCPSAEGIVTLTQEELDEIVDLAHKNNMQLAIHAIGDRTMYMAFNSIEKLIKENVKENYRHGIVHCQITDEYLLNKFKELDVIAYIQPIFLDYDWHIVKDRVGEKREKTSYNWKSLINKGVKTANGSDAPVETFNVLKGIYEAVTRKDLYGLPEGGWLPDQKLTVKEAVYGYTMGGAYASFEENIKGSIEKGKLADLVVLSEDIFSINEDMIKNVNVEMTVFNGKIVHEI